MAGVRSVAARLAGVHEHRDQSEEPEEERRGARQLHGGAHGKPAAVVISIDDLASLEETLDIAGRPELMRQIRDGLLQLDQAEVLSKDEALAGLRR